MSALAYTISDSRTLVRRNLRRLRRYPAITLMLLGMPIVFLLLFVYVFGGQLSPGLSRGLAGGHVGRGAHLNYVAPGILLMTVAATVQGTAIAVAMDMTGGIIDRFRTMAISRGARRARGGQPPADAGQPRHRARRRGGPRLPAHRLTAGLAGAIGVLTLFACALIWLATALGLAANSVETAGNTPMFLTLLPFLGSGFVPADTMPTGLRQFAAYLPTGLRQFAAYQPSTPVTETVRGLLTGTPVGNHAVLAIAWSVAIAAGSYMWAIRRYRRLAPR